MVCRRSASDTSRTGVNCTIPAQLTRAPGLETLATTSARDARSVMSQQKVRAPRSAAVSWTVSATSTSATSQSISRSPLAMALPISTAPPVTMAFFVMPALPRTRGAGNGRARGRLRGRRAVWRSYPGWRGRARLPPGRARSPRSRCGPGIDERHPHRFEVGPTTRDDRHVVHDGGRCNQRVALHSQAGYPHWKPDA